MSAQALIPGHLPPPLAKQGYLSLTPWFSTRKQQGFFKTFIGDSVSHQTASRLIQNLADELRLYQTRPIEDKYRFTIIDGLWTHIKELDIKKRPILFALGITKMAGRRLSPLN
ncbi:MAG: transposase [Candidatus Omnitrophica bacterium]|nr:transposase [Candidatus Omnitrophota bacterium]